MYLLLMTETINFLLKFIYISSALYFISYTLRIKVKQISSFAQNLLY